MCTTSDPLVPPCRSGMRGVRSAPMLKAVEGRLIGATMRLCKGRRAEASATRDPRLGFFRSR